MTAEQKEVIIAQVSALRKTMHLFGLKFSVTGTEIAIKDKDDNSTNKVVGMSISLTDLNRGLM